ncbi:MAG: hypothetical protein R3248_00630 [Candidatus Promineifilaceae bacterium]|nr:hypothetical protein [Candidatus Promineifilaceae bacterium]
MQDTYTYTARSAADPDRIVTFTLANGHMMLNLTGVMEQLSEVVSADEKAATVKEQVKKQVKPSVMKGIEQLSGPVHVRDVAADLKNERLVVRAWQRAGGLRLAPMVIGIDRVDNVEAAEAFVEELDARRNSVQSAGKFAGPLDYWFGWAALFLALIVLLRWPSKKR